MTTQFDQPLVRHRAPQPGEPVWEVANFFPRQGYWTETEYLRLTESYNWPMELNDGNLEILPMPTMKHQDLVAYIYQLVLTFVRANQLGKVFFVPRCPSSLAPSITVNQIFFTFADNFGNNKRALSPYG